MSPCILSCAGIVIEGPSNVTYLPGLTPLPIELTCNVTGVTTWNVDNTTYTIGQLTNGALPGHSRTGTNILVNSPVNNTEYICVSTTNDGDVSSDPAYIIIAGECKNVYLTCHTYICTYRVCECMHCILFVLCQRLNTGAIKKVSR